MSYYHRFLELFLDVAALASAPEDLVLKCWQGLGYYSRARNLLAAARRIVETHGGVFPTDYADVRALPGVGDYTAAAICSIAYDEPCAALDGNVFRVLSRLYDLDTPIDTTFGRRTFAALADSLIDRQRPGLYNQAIMDFGALAVFRHSLAVRSALCATVVWLLPPVRSMSVPSNRGVRLSNPAISTTCTSNAAMNWYCADGVPATFGRGCTNFRSSKLPNLWNIRCWPRCRSFALSSKMPGRYALPGPSRCPCISFRTGRSTLFSTGSSWSAGRPPCAKCSLFRVKSSAITPFPVLRSVIYPADSSFVRLRHTVCRLNQSKTYTKK